MSDELWLAGLPALFGPLAAFVTFAAWLAMPRSSLSRKSVMLLLGALLCSLIVYWASGLPMIVLGWTGSLLMVGFGLYDDEHARRTVLRAFSFYALLGTLPLLVALLMVRGHEHDHGALPLHQQEEVFWLLAAAALFRAAVVPFHSWLPALVERGPLWCAIPLFGAPLGPFLLIRTVSVFAPDAARDGMPIIATLALLSALYSGFVAVSQTDFRRAMGFILTSQSALSLSGLCEPDAESVHGALLQMAAAALTGTGLLLVLACLQARTGTSDLVRLTGEGRRFTRMTTSFFLFAAAAIGLPGTLHFVAEDLLLHGLLRTNVLHAVGLLLVTVLAGINLLRLFFRVFQGPVSAANGMAAHSPDLSAREGVVMVALVLAMWGLGIFPQHALDAVEHDDQSSHLQGPPHKLVELRSARDGALSVAAPPLEP